MISRDVQMQSCPKLSVVQGLRDLETVLAEAQQVIPQVIRADIFTANAIVIVAFAHV